ncbi:hypothetical protein O9993_02630 [Vibrio lentus]|nr:hypothetical protein [Vibrio lentus]
MKETKKRTAHIADLIQYDNDILTVEISESHQSSKNNIFAGVSWEANESLPFFVFDSLYQIMLRIP